ncbi:MAG: type II toxin-antitoxin system VapC family toxin [Candidatus Binataceae bacterium]
MNFLLDTNVISEWVKPEPDRNVVTWLAEADEDRVFVSVISFAEIRRGIELMVAGRRRQRLALWLAEELPLRFEDRILAVDLGVADTWGVVMARSEKKGHAMGSMDAFVAATAEAHDLTLVTRNIKDFEHVGISLMDPWQSRP